MDQAIYSAIAATPTPSLDEPLRRLSNAADDSRLWLAIAAGLAVTEGWGGRRAAVRGTLAIGVGPGPRVPRRSAVRIARINGWIDRRFWPGGARRVALACTGLPSAERRTWIKEEFMSVSEQVDALQQRAAELKSSAAQARHETDEQIKARIDKTKADIAARQDAVKAKAGQAARHAQSQWKSMKADAAAKTQDLRDRMDRQRDERDVKKAERQAEAAEEDAADALDYALWVVDQAELAVLDAIDARSWADARAATSPPS